MDYTNCKTALRFYSGSERKKSLFIDNEVFMIKFPKKAQEREKLDVSYTNNIYSEYIGCHILETMGFETQKTLLGYYGNKEIVACKDFVEDGFRLYEFAQIKNSVIDETSSSGYGTDLNDVLQTIEEQEIFPVSRLKEFFWDLFIADTLIGNFDRHNANWGFLINENTGEVKLAPVYDCGSCLYPKLSDEEIQNVLSDQEKINQRIFVFPNSALKQNNKKINYFDFINGLRNKDCNDALKRSVGRINLRKINDVIEAMPMASNLRKTFYQEMIKERYHRILKSSLEKLEVVERVPNYCESEIGFINEWEDDLEP